MKIIALFAVTCCMLFATGALSQPLWSDKPESSMRIAEGRMFFPEEYRTISASPEMLRDILAQAPSESDTPPARSGSFFPVPRPDGKVDSFRIVEYDMMESGLARRFPDIRTYRGVHIRDKRKTVRLQWTARGFGAMVSGDGNRYFVEPFSRGNREDYISFFSADYPASTAPFRCYVDDQPLDRQVQENRVSGDCVFRSYRFAVATTGEYANFHGANDVEDEDILLAEVVIATNRVNEVYERYVAVRLVLIENVTDVFYYDGATDPFTNGNGSAMLTENQNNMTAVIGSANYDVGHVFSTGGGGIAQLNVPCVNNSKAKGVTGLGSPVGDPFYIDYVAHEIGHQFGGRHTQNNSCNRDLTSSYEPGSASTIMGYAGICAPNVQDNSDAYFHGISVSQINNYITNGNGDNCDLPVPWDNNPPVALVLDDHSIPASTPFMLTGNVSDPDGDTLYYLWEQWDKEVAAMPPQSTNTLGPAFRSFFPDTSATRTFPAMQDIIDNNTPTWEVLPSVARTMNFRLTVFDHHDALAGCSDEENLVLNVAGGTGPFEVNSPNLGSELWTEGAQEEVNWDVAGTSGAPVNAAAVDIFLSRDGGMSFPDTLAFNEPNDGLALVEVPSGVTDQARIMIKGHNNVFFDISDENFEIVSGIPDYALNADPELIQFCVIEGTEEAVYLIEVISINEYSDSVMLSLMDIPPGANSSLGLEGLLPGESTTLTLSKLQSVPAGSYTVVIAGNSTSGVKTVEVGLDIVDTTAQPTLLIPADLETDVELIPALSWGNIPYASSYEIQIAEDQLFGSLVESASVSDTFYNVSAPLAGGTQYYWRVRVITGCSINSWSDAFSFTTESITCVVLNSDDVPVNIPSNGTPTVNSILEILDDGFVTDLNVLDLAGTHTYVSDLAVSLYSPDNTRVVLFDGICGSMNNWDLNFDDEAEPGSIPCPPTTGGTYQPQELLSTFNGKSVNGTWTLEIEDQFNLDGGELESWALQICLSDYDCNKTVVNTSGDGPGSLSEVFACAADGDTIFIDNSLAGETFTLTETLVFDRSLTIIGPDGPPCIFDGSVIATAMVFNSATTCLLQNVSIYSGTAPAGGGIDNNGSLTLVDVRVSSPGSPPVQGSVRNTGNMVLEGQCEVNQ